MATETQKLQAICCQVPTRSRKSAMCEIRIGPVDAELTGRGYRDRCTRIMGDYTFYANGWMRHPRSTVFAIMQELKAEGIEV